MNNSFLLILIILVVVLALLWTQTKVLNPVKKMMGVKVIHASADELIKRRNELVRQGNPKKEALDMAAKEHEQQLIAKGTAPNEARKDAEEVKADARQEIINRLPKMKECIVHDSQQKCNNSGCAWAQSKCLDTFITDLTNACATGKISSMETLGELKRRYGITIPRDLDPMEGAFSGITPDEQKVKRDQLCEHLEQELSDRFEDLLE